LIVTASSRRQFLRNAGLLAGALGCRRAFGRRPVAASQQPHYVVQILMNGGVDPVLTLDPRDPTTVAGTIDCLYTGDQRLSGRRRLYGPLMKELLRHERDLCILQGVRVDTVSHIDGEEMLSRGRTAYGPSTPWIGDVIGPLLPGGAPIEHLVLPDLLVNAEAETRRGHSAVEISLELAERVLAQGGAAFAPAAGLPATRTATAASARRLLRVEPGALSCYLTDLERAEQLRGLLHSFRPRSALPTSDPRLGPRLGVALHAIRTNQARYITVQHKRLWFDSHTDNLHIQTTRVPPAFRDLATFLDHLKTERNVYGPLIDQTTIVVGSELGRFPRVNGVQGKDHWPENSWILAGKGIRLQDDGVTVGATDARLKGLPVDYQTGSLTSANARPLFLDAIFATLVHLAGGDPKAAGYARDDVLQIVCA
jgi:uncharacterized protein (DUF1501 family)